MFLANRIAILQVLFIIQDMLINFVNTQACEVNQYCSTDCTTHVPNTQALSINAWKQKILTDNLAQYCKTKRCGVNPNGNFVCKVEAPPPLEGISPPLKNKKFLCKPGEVCGPGCGELSNPAEWGKNLASFYISSFFNPGCNPIKENISSCKLSKAGLESAQKVLDEFGTYSITGHCRFHSQNTIVPIVYGCEDGKVCDKTCTQLPKKNRQEFRYWYYPEAPEWSYHIPLFEGNCDPRLNPDCRLNIEGLNLTKQILNKLAYHCGSGQCKYISKADLTPLCVNNPKTSSAFATRNDNDKQKDKDSENDDDFWIESKGNRLALEVQFQLIYLMLPFSLHILCI